MEKQGLQDENSWWENSNSTPSYIQEQKTKGTQDMNQERWS